MLVLGEPVSLSVSTKVKKSVKFNFQKQQLVFQKPNFIFPSLIEQMVFLFGNKGINW